MKETQPTSLIELASRLVFSLLRAAVRLAARFQMPMERLMELTQLAYFQELRRRSPRDLSKVARDLGMSLRTAGTLNRRLKEDFFAPEYEVAPVRQITGALLKGEQTLDELASATGLEPEDVQRAIGFLSESGWVAASEDRYHLQTSIRSFVTEDLDRRVDALNNQMDILANSVWARFVEHDASTSRARSWVFAAREADIASFIERAIPDIRHQAIDLEEAALADNTFTRYGVTLAFAPMEGGGHE